MVEVRTKLDAPPRRRRRLLRILAITAGVLCVLVIMTLVALHTPPARRAVLSRVTDLLAAQQIDFSTDELRYNLFDLSLSVRNLRVRSPQFPQGPPFAVVSRAQLDLSLMQLLRGKYVVESGTADDVQIHYFVAEDGRDNLPRTPTSTESSEPVDYLIADLNVSNARVRYENRVRQIDLALPVSSLVVKGNSLTDRHEVRVEGAAGELHVQGRTATIDRVSAQVDLGQDDVNITRVDLAAAGSNVALTGSIAELSDSRADLAIRAHVDAARMATVAGIKDTVGGTLELDATVKGPLSAPALQTRITGSELQFREIADVELAATLAYDLSQQRAEVTALTVGAPWGTVAGDGSVALQNTGGSRVQAEITAVDTATLMRALNLPYVIATRVNGRVQAEWPGLEYLKATGEVSATLTPTTSRVSQSVMPVGGRLIVDAREGRMVANIENLSAAGAVASGRVTLVDGQRLDGQVKTRVADLGRAVSTAEAFLGRPQGSLLPTPVQGPVMLNARVGGTITAPTAAGSIEAPSLSLGTASDIAVRGNVAYAPAAVRIDGLDVIWQQARAHASGRVGLTGAKRLDLVVDANQLEIAELLRAFNQATVPASGSVSLHGVVAGSVSQPVATLTLQGSNLTAYQELLGSLDARATLAAREVTLSELVIDKPQADGNGRVTASGRYHLDRGAYTVEVRSENLRLLGAMLPDGTPLRGDLQLTANGDGTVRTPAGQFHLTADAFRFGEYDLGGLAVDGSVANQQATITAAAPRFSLDAEALIGVQRPYSSIIKLRANGLQLAALPLQMQTPLDGELRATVEAQGDLIDLTRGRATANIEAFAGTWNDLPFSIDAPSTLRYADERLGIERLRVTAQDSTVVVSGELPLVARAGEGVINLEARANLATLTQYAPAGTNITGDGAVTLVGTLRGTLKAIDPDLVLTVENGLILAPEIEPGISNVTLRAHVVKGEANIEQLSANWGTAQLSAKGRIPLEVLPALPVEIPRAGGPATFTASVQGLDPAAIPGAPAGLSGLISVDAQIAANRADLAALDGRITFPDLRLAFSGLTLAQQQPSIINIAGGAAELQQFRLAGTAGDIAGTGTVGLTGTRALNVNVDGNLNVGAVSLFTDQFRADGKATLQVAARGTISTPELDGYVELADATLIVDEPAIAAEGLSARVDLSGSRVTLASLNADVNGGTLKGSGTLALGGGGGLEDVDLQFTLNNFAFDAPLDLRSLSDSVVRITDRNGDIVVDGQVTIEEAGLTGDINFDTGLLTAMTARRKLDLTEERSPLMERLRFNINIDTAMPVLVDNNLARAEITTDLRVVGTPYEPGLSGRLTVLEGGEITLNERRYQVERGVITFLDERRIFPSFDLLLNTSAGNYDITLSVSGSPGDTETTLTSDPVLPETDIMAILVTGRTLDEMRGEEFEVAREQVLSYLTGRVGSGLGRGIERATGLSEVRLEPNLIANEANPGARLTVGQELTDDLTLVYSTNLADSSDQIWVAEYDVTRRFETRTIRQSDNSYRFELRHDIRLGGRPAPGRVPRQRPIVTSVSVTADTEVREAQLRDLLDIEEGDSYDFFAVRDGIERIEELYRERGYLQARVRLKREVDAQTAKLTLNVRLGPVVEVRFEGMTPPDDVQEEVRIQWTRGVFDAQRADDGVEALRAWLMLDSYLEPKIEYTVEDVALDRRRVVFRIAPGTRFDRIIVAFEGASAIAPDELDDIINDQGLEQELFTDPVVVTELLERYYREQGYQAAEIDEPRYEFKGAEARVVLEVREGPLFTIRNVTTSGNAVIPTPVILDEVPVVGGDPFLPATAETSLQRIQQLYWSRGYNDVRSDYELAVDRATGHVDVAFTIEEGLQSVVADITIEGNDEASNRLVRQQLELQTSQPLDIGALSRSRRNLYDTGAFSIVDITREELSASGEVSAVAAPGGQGAGAGDTKPIRLNVSVREVQPFQLRYGVSYDTERGVGGILDVSNHNSLGKARVLGVRSRYDSQLHEVRGYLSQPSLRYWPVQTTGTVYYREERNPLTDRTAPFNVDRQGVSIQSEMELRDSYIWSNGYQYERTRTFDPAPGGLLDQTVTISPLSSTLTREARDEVLDASRGSFTSQSFAYSPSWLGSDLPYLRYFGQYFHYFPLRPPQRERFTHEIIRPRFVYATGVRVGLARGIGGGVPLSERFYAGGSTTLRGFAQNAVGPIALDRVPTGGDGLLVINNELRFPLVSIVDGVAFADVGNVFERVSEFSFTDLRESVGVGLRVRTPWFLLRGDYGFVLDHRPDERRSRFYFSIGQAF